MAEEGAKNVEKEKPIIVLHSVPRGRNCPSPSPFPLKVETFLRMNKLQYTCDFKPNSGPKGSSPWITDTDGSVVADSQFIIEHLTKKNNIQMVSLSPQDAAVALGMKSILEDNLYFVLMAESGSKGDFKLLVDLFPHKVPRTPSVCLQHLAVAKIRSCLNKKAHSQGIGRHSSEALHHIGMADLEAISICLGNKEFMMGSSPCPIDCSVFGFLAVLFYVYPEDFFFRKEAEEKFPNLKSFTDRIKNAYWEDWDDLLTKEKQK